MNATEPKTKFLVLGSCMEYMAHLCCEAESEEQALTLWDRAFQEYGVSRQGFLPQVYPAPPEKETYVYYSGSYNYSY